MGILQAGILPLLQGIFLTQESNWGLLHCRWIPYQLSHQGSPKISKVAPQLHMYMYLFLSGLNFDDDISLL